MRPCARVAAFGRVANSPGMETPSTPAPEPTPPSDRRDFLTKAAAIAIGGAITVVPPVAGLCVFLDPLRRPSTVGASVLVASLNALTEGGEPRKFPVLADKSDAWNRATNVPIGAVYLQRLKDNKVRALNVVCPHAGCFVNYRGGQNDFFCPCHTSAFALDGKKTNEIPPRDMDSLEVSMRTEGEDDPAGQEIWVRYQKFRGATAEKIAV